MMLFKNAELILENLSIAMKIDCDNSFAILGLAEIEKVVVDVNHKTYKLTDNPVTVALEHTEIDEIIALLQDFSRHLKCED